MAIITTEIKNLIGFFQKNDFYVECPCGNLFKLEMCILNNTIKNIQV
jgi:hypothetical protein